METVQEIVWNLDFDWCKFGSIVVPEKEDEEIEALLKLWKADFIKSFIALQIQLCCFRHERRGQGSYRDCILRPFNLSCWHMKVVVAKYLIAIEILYKQNKIHEWQKKKWLGILKRNLPSHVTADNTAFNGYESEISGKKVSGISAKTAENKQRKIWSALLSLKTKILAQLN